MTIKPCEQSMKEVFATVGIYLYPTRSDLPGCNKMKTEVGVGNDVIAECSQLAIRNLTQVCKILC